MKPPFVTIYDIELNRMLSSRHPSWVINPDRASPPIDSAQWASGLNTGSHIINPQFVTSEPRRYWKADGVNVIECSNTEKLARDAVIQTELIEAKQGDYNEQTYIRALVAVLADEIPTLPDALQLDALVIDKIEQIQ